jgi:hypothetical protein
MKVINPYVDFMVEDPYQKAQREAEQRAMLAQILEQQAFQPFEQRPAPISRTEGIAKLLAAGLAGYSRREQREAEQRARQADLQSAIKSLEEISRPTEKIESEELMRMPGQNVERLELLPGKFDITPVAPEISFDNKGEVTGFKPGELQTTMRPAGPGISGFNVETGEPQQFVDEPTALSESAMFLPEMSKEQKRAAYIRMLGGGPVSQAFGQQGITDLMKPAEIPPAPVITGGMQYDRKTGTWSVIPGYEEMEIRIAEGKRPPPQPRDEPIYQVIDPVTGQAKYVTRSEAIGMSPPQPRDEPIYQVKDPVTGQTVYVKRSEALGMSPPEADKDSSNEDKLRREFDAKAKPFLDELAQIGKVGQILNSVPPNGVPTAIQQDVLVTLLLKFIEPTSVVREGEFDRIVSRQGFVQKAENIKNRLLTGAPLTADMVKQIGDMAALFDQAANSKIRGIASQYKTLAEKRELDITNIVLDPNYLAEPTSYPTRGPASRGRPRIPGAGTGSAPQVDVGGANAIIGR